MSNFQKNAKLYIDRSWSVLPVEPRGKKPYKSFSWKNDSLNKEQLPNYQSVCNTGVILGDRSNGLIDIDCDIPEAAVMAWKMFGELPSFGRASSPHSHFVATSPDAGKTTQYELTKDQAEILGIEDCMVLELRGNGGQTVFPGSTHGSGEAIEWCSPLPDELPIRQWNDLQKRTAICAFLAIVLIKYPTQEGSRDNICLALAGTLLRAGLTPEEADALIVYIAEQKGDQEANARAKAQGSQERLDAGDDVTGLPTLCKLLGIEELENTLSKWLYGSSPSKPANDALEEIKKLNKRYFVIGNEGGKCVVASFEPQPIGKGKFRDTLSFQAKGDFQNWLANHQVIVSYTDDGIPIFKPLGKVWWEHSERRQYERVVFMPEQDVPDDVLNLWRGYGVKGNKGSWRRMLRHIWRVLAKRNPEVFKYILKWCAWTVQNPDCPAEVALVLRGGKGTGKGTFCNALVDIFGHHGLAISSTNHLTGRFNSHMRDTVLLFADEATVPNDPKGEGILKALITEPKILIEGKGRDPIQCVNRLHILMASNDDWVVSASADERRYAVFDISGEVAQQENWFGPLNHELENGGLEAMLHAFQNIELGSWHPRKGIPVSEAMQDQKIQSLKGLQKLWFDYLSTGEADGSPQNSGIAIPTKFFASKTQTTTKAAGEFLKKMGCTHDRNSRPTTWITPPLEEARKVWERELFPVPWNEEDAWLPVPIPPGEPPF